MVLWPRRRLPPRMPGRGSGDPALAAAAHCVISAVGRWRGARSPLVVAIDGHGAAGKSTIAGRVAEATGAALVHTDDFFRPPAGADAGLAIGRYYDWARLRAEALEPLLAGRASSFRAFDWEPDGTGLGGTGLGGTVTVLPSHVIVVEGVSSAAPALSDLVHRAVFVDTPPAERLRRLRERVRPEDWDDEWLAAEHAYLDLARPRSSFDLIVPGAGAGQFRQ